MKKTNTVQVGSNFTVSANALHCHMITTGKAIQVQYCKPPLLAMGASFCSRGQAGITPPIG